MYPYEYTFNCSIKNEKVLISKKQLSWNKYVIIFIVVIIIIEYSFRYLVCYFFDVYLLILSILNITITYKYENVIFWTGFYDFFNLIYLKKKNKYHFLIDILIYSLIISYKIVS